MSDHDRDGRTDRRKCGDPRARIDEARARGFEPVTALSAVRVLGRRAADDGADGGATLWWTNSGLEFDFDGTGVEASFYADWDMMEPWVCVELDGVMVSRFPVHRGYSEVTLFRGMNPGRARSWHVRLLRESEPQPGDSRQMLRVCGLHGEGGGFLPLRPVTRRLEFIGDSITAGEGAIGQMHDNDWSDVFFSAWNGYPRMVGEAFGADFRQIAISGWGIRSSWDNHPGNVVPRIYDRVCGVLDGPEQVRRGSQKGIDPAAWQPDAICVNLGTNDASAFSQPGVPDPATGTVFKERTNPDGSKNKEDLAAIVADLRSFLTHLRSLYPKALILVDYGLFSREMIPVLRQGVTDYRQRSGDGNVVFLELPAMEDRLLGSHEHPGKAAHLMVAKCLVAELARLLGWPSGHLGDDGGVRDPGGIRRGEYGRKLPDSLPEASAGNTSGKADGTRETPRSDDSREDADSSGTEDVSANPQNQQHSLEW